VKNDKHSINIKITTFLTLSLSSHQKSIRLTRSERDWIELMKTHRINQFVSNYDESGWVRLTSFRRVATATATNVGLSWRRRWGVMILILVRRDAIWMILIRWDANQKKIVVSRIRLLCAHVNKSQVYLILKWGELGAENGSLSNFKAWVPEARRITETSFLQVIEMLSSEIKIR
jgi:hypothetical protein